MRISCKLYIKHLKCISSLVDHQPSQRHNHNVRVCQLEWSELTTAYEFLVASQYIKF